MKVLCIGNSFSTDATAYLSRVATSAGVSLETYNLYIGGCSLARHWKNVETQEKRVPFGDQWSEYGKDGIHSRYDERVL